MKLIYYQPYTKKRATKCWYGKPPKGVFKYDTIKLQFPDGISIYITPDEGADIIRAISAGLHHFLVKDKKVVGIIEAKRKSEALLK